jgi:hypothetical protein
MLFCSYHEILVTTLEILVTDRDYPLARDGLWP